MANVSFDNFYYENFFGNVGFIDINLLLEGIDAVFTEPLDVGNTFNVTFDTVFPLLNPTITVTYAGTDKPAGSFDPGSIFFGGNAAVDTFISDLVAKVEEAPTDVELSDDSGTAVADWADAQAFLDAIEDNRTDDTGGSVDGDPNHFLDTNFVITDRTLTGGEDFPEIDAVTYCFAAGTLIATPDGAVPVERLCAGDFVLASDGRAVPVKWMGRQTLEKRFTPPERFRPVRIRAGALAEGVPARDLVVTPDHGILIGDVMVCAGALVNGTTIVREPLAALADRVVYHHVETERHDVILAEGTPAETFVDSLTRRGFDNYAEYEALFGPEEALCMAELPYARAMSARQLPARVRARLSERAALIGATLAA